MELDKKKPPPSHRRGNPIRKVLNMGSITNTRPFIQPRCDICSQPVESKRLLDAWKDCRCEAGKWLRGRDLEKQKALARVADMDQRKAVLEEKELAERERQQSIQDRRRDALADAELDLAEPEGITLDDLAAVFDDEVDLTPTPAVVEREDGAMVLPSGKLNWIYGLPGSGKSFLCMMNMIEAIMKGGRCAYMDYEDNKTTFHQRAAILGFNLKEYSDSFKYIKGGVADYPVAFAEVVDFLADAPSTDFNQVIIDAAESSGCPSDGSPVNEWLAKVVLPWRNTGADTGCLVADHIPKTKQDRPDGPIGSQRKMAAVDGISMLVSGYCWTKTKNGKIILTNDKDRTGSYGRKEPVATIVGTWEGDGDSRTFTHSISPPTKDASGDNTGGHIINVINDAGDAGFSGKSNLFKAVGGNRNVVFRTIDSLVEGGFITMTKDKGTDIYRLTEEGFNYAD